MTTPTAKPPALTAQATIDHYRYMEEDSAEVVELKRLREVNAGLMKALQDFRDLRARLDGISDAESRGRIYADVSARAAAALAASKEN